MVDQRVYNTLRSIFYALVGLLLWLPHAGLGADSIQVEVTQRPVTLDESFVLSFETDQSVDGEPEFGPLEKDFKILNRQRMTHVNVLNGHQEHKTQWQLELMAKHAGQLTIPSIRFGDQQSAALQLTVHKTQPAAAGPHADQDVFLTVRATPHDPYVQSQVQYRVRIYRAVNLGRASMSKPGLEDGDAVIEKLGDDHSFRTTRNGRQFLVTERNYALFPQQSGTVTISPLEFQAQVIERARSLGNPFRANKHIKRLHTKAIELRVKSVPPGFPGTQWLPSQGLELHEAWSKEPPQFRVGEPITRTLSLHTKGLTAGQIPVIRPPLPDGFKRYPDQPKLDNDYNQGEVTGKRQQKTALIPTTAGPLRLPAVEVPWWNTKTHQPEVARIDARTVTVLPATGGQANAKPAPTTNPDQPDKANTSAPSNHVPAGDDTSKRSIWPWISLGLAIGWLITLMLLVTRKALTRRILTPAEEAPTRRAACRRIRHACRANDPEQAKSALLEWARIVWPSDRPSNLAGVAGYCEPALGAAILNLNQHLYGRRSQGWDRGWNGAELRRQFDAHPAPGQQASAAAESPETTRLEPLFKRV